MRFVVRSHTSHLNPINDNIIILINKLREIFRGFQGDFRELVQTGAQTEMKAKHIESRIGCEVVQNKK